MTVQRVDLRGGSLLQIDEPVRVAAEINALAQG